MNSKYNGKGVYKKNQNFTVGGKGNNERHRQRIFGDKNQEDEVSWMSNL